MVWTIDNSEPLQILAGHTNVVENVSFANDAAAKTIQSSSAFQGIDH